MISRISSKSRSGFEAAESHLEHGKTGAKDVIVNQMSYWNQVFILSLRGDLRRTEYVVPEVNFKG